MKLKETANKIYFVSQYDNEVHNLRDCDHIIENDGKTAMIGKWVMDGGSESLRVDEAVDLYTIDEIYKFYKDEK